MPDPNKPLDVVQVLGDILTRLRNLETRNTMQSTSILAIVDNGTPDTTTETVARFGDLGGGVIGVEIGSQLASPALLVDSVNGMVFPEMPIPYQTGVNRDFNDNAVNIVWAGYSQRCSHSGVEYASYVQTGVGDTVEVWLQDAYGGSTSHVAVGPSVTQQVSFAWLHTAAIGAENQFSFRAQRTAGTTQYTILEPFKFAYVGPDGCTVTGI